jgi:hypothetical protein
LSQPRRYCLRGHDTDVFGRDASRRCRVCHREGMAAMRRVKEAAMAAERARHRKEAQKRQEQERARWRASLRGEELLNQLEVEAQLDGRCLEPISADPPAVCGRKLGPGAGVTRFFCREHDVPLASERREREMSSQGDRGK